MKKRHIVVAAAVLMGGGALVEMQTGWLFGNEASAASAGGGAAPIPLPMPLSAAVLPGRAVAGVGASFAAPAGPAATDDQQPTIDADGDSAGPPLVAGAAEAFGDPGGQLVVLGGGGGMARFADGGDLTDGGFGGGGGGGGGQPQIFAAASTGPAVSGVPEPASWITLITGLLLVGVNVRNRRSARSVAS
jgi:hypothetical protein